MKSHQHRPSLFAALAARMIFLPAVLALVAPVASFAASFTGLNLQPFFNHTNAALPPKLVLRGVPFTLNGAVQVTGLDAARRGEFWPGAVTGIPVNRAAARLHLLLGAQHGSREGMPLANLVLHYQNGESHALRLAFGLHTRNVLLERDAVDSELADPNAQLAWQTNSGRFNTRLHHAVFDNPRPGEEIARIDFVSLFSRATPVLFGITLQDDASPALLAPLKTKVLQRATELTDAAYRREIPARVTDMQGQPLAGATASLSVTDDARTFFLGQFRADAAGKFTLAYPPQDAVALHVRVNHSGFAPASVSLDTREAKPWPETIELRLERGQPIGGLVVDADSQPVPGATVTPFQITSAGLNQFTRTDLDQVVTDAQGRWTAHAATLTNLTIEATHPDFHATQAAVSAAELEAKIARVSLRPHVRFAGRVLNAAGRPVADATVTLYNEDQGERRTVSTDAEGRYKFIIHEPANDDAQLVAIAPGFAPSLRTTRLNRLATGLDFTLGAGQPFTMRLTDGEGVALPGVSVSLFSWQGSRALPWTTVTDARGRFTWANAPTGSVTWRYEKTGFINHTHSMTLPQKGEASFTYNRPIRIAGRVLDAATQRPLDSFRYRVSYEYANGSGSSSGTGRRGTFNTTLSSAGKYTEVSVQIEAANYEPQVVILKPPYGLATNDFLMQKAKLLEVTVVTRNGQPAAGAEVVLLSKSASAYMDVPGKFRRTSSFYDVVLADENGVVSLTPKPDADLVLVAHPQLGFAQVSTNEFLKTRRVTLEPWGVVKGVLRVGPGVEPDQFVAIHAHYIYDGTPQQRSTPSLYLYYRLEPEPDGTFFCDSVPPGERMVQLRYYTPSETGNMRLSHNQPVTVKPGVTNDVMIGGTGRTVTGNVVLEGLPDVKIDEKRGEFQLRLQPGPQPSEIPPPLRIPPQATPEERARLRAEHTAKIQEAARNRLRASRFLQRNYLLRFDGNNRFTVPNVPPGNYQLIITPHDPRSPRTTNRQLGSSTRIINVPEGTTAFDTGTTTLEARNRNQ